jgi:DNA-binding transcriptional LysR family regulator
VVLDLPGELLTPAQVTRLIDGTLDLGLLRPPVRERDLITEVLRSEPLVAVLPESHPLADSEAVPLAQRRGEPFVTYPSLALPIGAARRRRGCLRRPRLQTHRQPRRRRDRDARQLCSGPGSACPSPRPRCVT